jgi:WD40 repeat protein
MSVSTVYRWNAGTASFLARLETADSIKVLQDVMVKVKIEGQFVPNSDATWMIFASGVAGVHLKRLNLDATEDKAVEWRGHVDPITDLAISRDDRTVISASQDNSMIICDNDTGSIRHRCEDHPDDVNLVLLSGDDRIAVAGCADGSVWCWDVASGAKIDEFNVGLGTITAMSLSEDDSLIAVATASGPIEVWKMPQERGSDEK